MPPSAEQLPKWASKIGEVLNVESPSAVKIHYTGWAANFDETVPLARLHQE